MSWNFGIKKIEGLSEDEFFKKLEDDGLIQWVDKSCTVVKKQDFKEGQCYSPSISCGWIADHFNRIFNLVAFGYAEPSTKEKLKEELVKGDWVCGADRIGLIVGKRKKSDAYKRAIRAMEKLHKWYKLVYEYERKSGFDGEIISWISSVEALFLSDYYVAMKEIQN